MKVCVTSKTEEYRGRPRAIIRCWKSRCGYKWPSAEDGTDDGGIAERLQLIRNHAEVVVAGMGMTDITNMVEHISAWQKLSAK